MKTEQERLRRKIREAKATQKTAEHKLDMLQVLFHEEAQQERAEAQEKYRDAFFNPLPNKQAPCIILLEGQHGLKPVRHNQNNRMVTKQFGTPHAAENYALCDSECQRKGYQIMPVFKAEVSNALATPVPNNRCTGQTFRALLNALVSWSRGKNTIIFFDNRTRAESATKQLHAMCQNYGIVSNETYQKERYKLELNQTTLRCSSIRDKPCVLRGFAGVVFYDLNQEHSNASSF